MNINGIIKNFTFNHSKLKNDKSNNVNRNAADTITSTDRCGPLRYKEKF